MESNWRWNVGYYGLSDFTWGVGAARIKRPLVGYWTAPVGTTWLVTNQRQANAAVCFRVLAGMPVDYAIWLLTMPNPFSNFPYGFTVLPDH